MIVSLANLHVKHIRSLAADRKDRRRERLFVLEGVRAALDALSHGLECTLMLYAPDQLVATADGQRLLGMLEHMPVAHPATAAVVAAACDTVQPQGVVMLARWPLIEPGTPGIILVVEATQDPGNLGTLLRSAEAVGVAEVLCTTGTVDVYSPKVVRSAMGAHLRLAIEQDLSWEAVAERLHRVDHVYAADARATMPYYAVDWRQPTALILGNEAHGLSDNAHKNATAQIGIPMQGGAESLNVGVAGSIILFEGLRQRTRGRA